MLESVRSCCGSGFSPCQSLPSHYYPDFKFADVPKAYVRSQLRGLKAGKVAGLDIFPARLLVDSADIVAKPLTSIINMSLKSGVVPLEWKSVHVIALFKKGKSD